jgi:hypothetical protein
MAEGRYADAITAADQSAAIFERLAHARGRAEAALLRARIAIALGDAAHADEAMRAIALDHLSSEQHAAFLLAGARRAAIAGDHAAVADKLDAAAKVANDMHSAVGVQIQLERVRLALADADLAHTEKLLAAVRAESTHLGEVPLRLQWLELEIAAALRAGKVDDAAARYRQALAILKSTGRWGDAAILHRLGSLALAGHVAEAEAARASAEAQQAQLVQDAPESARASLLAELARRLRDEQGTRHGE